MEKVAIDFHVLSNLAIRKRNGNYTNSITVIFWAVDKMNRRGGASFAQKHVIKPAIVFDVPEDLTASKRNGKYNNSIVCRYILGYRKDSQIVSKYVIRLNMSHDVEGTT